MISDSKRIEELNKLMKKVTDLESRGAVDKAIDELDKARRTFPEDGNLLNHLGDLYIRANRIKEAVDAYQAGVAAYAKDTFYRNAIGLGKKVLRHAPDNVEMYRTVADLLIELGQRADASGFYLAYLERLEKAGRTNEAVDLCKRVLSMGMSDQTLLKKIDEIYLAAGLKERKKVDVREVIKLRETPAVKPQVFEERTVDLTEPQVEKPVQAKELRPAAQETQEKPRETTAPAKEILVLPEIVAALGRTIADFSDSQKSILNTLQGSLERHVGNLVQSVDELKTTTHSNVRDSERLITALGQAVTALAEKNETSLRKLSEGMETSNEKLTKHILEGSGALATETRRYSLDTKESYKELGDKFETLDKTVGGVGGEVNEAKVAISRLENFLISYVMGQDTEIKKNRGFLRLFTMIITSALFVIAVLLLVLVLKK